MEDVGSLRELIKSYKLRLKLLEEKYRLELSSKDKQVEIYRQEIAYLRQLSMSLIERPNTSHYNNSVHTTTDNKFMSGSSDHSRKIEITGGNVNASGAGALSLGDISGTVANTINQLPSSSKLGQPALKEQLEQLKAVIESEPSLSDQDKADALKLVEDLAVAGKAPQESAKQQVAKTAIRTLKGIISDLPDIAKLAEAGKTLLPMIAHLFGL